MQPTIKEDSYSLISALQISLRSAVGGSIYNAAKISGYICGIVILNHGDSSWVYAIYRFVETALGIGVAVGVSFIPKFLKNEIEV